MSEPARTPARPWEFHGVIRLTKVGLVYIAATLVMAVAAINTGNNAIYIGVSFMLGALLLSGMASKGGLRHLEIEIGGIDEAWAGRVSHGVLRIRNTSRVWNVRDVVFVSASLEQPLFVPVIPRGERIEIAAPFLFRRRGIAQIGAIDSYTRYPFGLVLKRRRLSVASEIVVFPRVTPGASRRERFALTAGDQASSGRAGPGTDVHAFREYARGDSLRHVYWKKSASIGRWIIKQTELETTRSVHVVVDPYKPRGVSDETFEEMIGAAATFIYDAAAAGLEVTLSLPRAQLRGHDARGMLPLYRALALLEPLFEPAYQKLERNSTLFSAAGGHVDAKSA